MNDKAIRKVLIEYIKTKAPKVRIYQEKSIGSSICDMMAVTELLTGYEIKSDIDNYERLPEQIRAYNQFFDRNYIVVGQGHSKSAENHVPKEWGILCISEDKVELHREARRNLGVSRSRQLSILWMLELKNLLVKNRLPMYAQKEKSYIADRIVESVSEEELGRQIANELMERDYAVYDVKDYTIRSEKDSVGYENLPVNEIIDSLSEKDLTDFTLDQWIALYREAKAAQERKAEAEERVIERQGVHEIKYTDIEVSLGAPWIEPRIIHDFINHLLQNMSVYGVSSDRILWVEYEPITGNWHVNYKKTTDVEKSIPATVWYGTKRFNALMIIESSLNLREIKIYDDGKYNEKETIAALDKQRIIDREFKEWIWKDEDRIWIVEEAYNKLFSAYDKKEFDGSQLTFPGMAEGFELFPYQKDAVQRVISTPNTLLAFDVGAGKTYIMIAAAMLMREQGISRKNMFVVPNNIVGQWEKIFCDLYPKAKLLTIEPKSYKPELREKVLKQIRNGDYDGIIIAYSCFEIIPPTVTRVVTMFQEELDKLNLALNDYRRYTSSRGDMLHRKEQIEKLLQEYLDKAGKIPVGAITFDDLEINTLFLDEAHNYKNLPIETKMKNLNGINTAGSEKCMDMLRKVRSVQEANGGRGVVFATGTPLCNSISDTYAMQMYLQPKSLEKGGLHIFDNWVKTFAKPEQVLEVDVDTSKFRMVRRFGRFFNLPELSKMFSEIAVFYAMNDKDDLPKLDAYSDVVIPKSGRLSAYMQTLCERTERIRQGDVDRKKDNMLKVSTDGRKAALSLELVGREEPYDEYSKVKNCVDQVMRIYREYEHCSQLIFCDYSTPKAEQFNVYQELKLQLMEEGIPEKEIAFIHSFHSESTKLKLYEQVNAGIVRVLIGSTFKLGIGANVQTKLKAIHHLDVPWRPADMVQREGRIIRRGNENENVFIYRYISEGSFDAYSWQILENKQKFITQFLQSSSYQRTAVDLESNVLTYAEVKALALSEPLMKELAEKENELRNERILYQQEIESREQLIRERDEVEKARDAALSDSISADNVSRFVKGTLKKMDTMKLFLESLQKQLTPEFMNGKRATAFTVIPSVRIQLPEDVNAEKTVVILSVQGQPFEVELGENSAGNVKRVMNRFRKLQTFGEEKEKEWKDLYRRGDEMDEEIHAPYQHEHRVLELEAEYQKIRDQIPEGRS